VDRPPTVDLDLSWVTFTEEEHGDSCGYHTACSAEATHVAIFTVLTSCGLRRVLACLTHEQVIRNEARRKGGLFGCHDCHAFPVARFMRMEPLRG